MNLLQRSLGIILKGCGNQVRQQNQKCLFNKLRYAIFNISKQKNESKNSKERSELLKEQLKQYKEEKKFMIRKPFTKDFYITPEQSQKQLKEANEMLDKYLKEYKFEQPFSEENFIQLLSKISQTVNNKNILERKDFQDLLLERAEKSYLFKDFRQFCLFFAFCSVQQIDHPSLWECFNGFVASNYINFSTNDKVLLLSSVNYINAHEMECFFEIFENELLKDVQVHQIPNFEKMFALLQLYRNANQGSKDFYETIETLIGDNIDEISIEALTKLITHYSNNQNEKHDSRVKMMNIFEKRILKICRFINPQELIAIFYNYIKIGMGSDLLFRNLEERIFLLIEDFNIQQINKILIIASNRSESKKTVFAAVEAFVLKNLEKLNEQTLPQIFFNYCENSIGSEKFYTVVENKLVSMAHNMAPELLSKCTWGFTVAETDKGDLFYKKSEEASLIKLKEFSVKDLSTLIWSFARVQKGSSEFYEKVEKQIQSRFNVLKGKDCAQLLWAYTQNHPLTIYSIEFMRGIILRDRKELDCWDVSMILWSYTKFEEYDSYDMFVDLQEQMIQLLDEMLPEEFIYCFRSYLEVNCINKDLINKFLEKTQESLDLKNINYDQTYILTWVFSSLPESEITQDVIQIIKQLEERLKLLQMPYVQNEQNDKGQSENQNEEEEEEDKFRINDIEFYKENLELEKLKNQENK
ncbi:hypothetical protein ABPG72_022725 [Tetrahymena utriculariae]